MKHRLFSTRVVFVVVTVVTLILLSGSIALQRIVFKADQVAGAVLLSPPSLAVAPQNKAEFKVQADFSSPASVVAAQFGFSVSDEKAELVNVTAADGWQTKKFVTASGQTHWLILPKSERGTVVTLVGLTTFGTISLAAQAEGNTQIRVLPAETIISAIDPTTSNVYNAVSTVQDAVLAVKASNTTAASPTAPVADNQLTGRTGTTYTGSGSLQRIVASNIFAYPTSAVLFVSLRYQGTVEVEFGKTTALGNNVETIEPSANHVVRLSGLGDVTRYYYRITARTNERSSRVISQTQSFTTTLGDGLTVDPTASELKVFPPLSQDTATAFIILRDQTGAVVANQPPTITVTSGQATLATTVSSGGQYQFLVHSELNRRQVVRLRATVNGLLIGEQSIMFDPNFTAAKLPQESEMPSLPLSDQITILLVALSMAAVLLGWFLVRLARLK